MATAAHRRPLIAFLVIFCVFSNSKKTKGSAFAHQRVNHSNARSNSLSSFSFQNDPRRGWARTVPSWQLKTSSSSSSTSSKLSSSDEEPTANNEDYEHSQQSALEAMKKCYKLCFLSVIVEVITTIIDDDIWYKSLGEGTLSWVDIVDVIDSLNLLVFGFGLMRVARLYFDKLNQDVVAESDLLDLFRTMSRVWGSAAVAIGAVSVSMAASLPVHGRGGPFQVLLDKVSPSSYPIAALGVLLFGNFGIRAYSYRNAISEVETDNETIETIKNSTAAFQLGRDIGYKAFRNQALCAGSFAVLSTVSLLKWGIEGNGIIARVLGLSQIAEPIAITALLVVLNRAFLRAAIAGTRYIQNKSVDDVIFKDLYLAQTSFYNKVATAIKGATTARVLPYVTAAVLPYLISTAKTLAPSLADKVFGTS